MSRIFKLLSTIMLSSTILCTCLLVFTVIPQPSTKFLTNANAYPAPETATPQSFQAYPAPNGATPTPIISKIEFVFNFSPSYSYFLPLIMGKPPRMYFSVAGATDIERIHQVVPQGVSIDGYSWDTLPANSSIQMIRSCLYYRHKANGHFYEWYWKASEQDPRDIAGHLCWDPLFETIARIVDESTCTMRNDFGQCVWSCPVSYGNKPCLDVEVANYPEQSGRNLFKEMVITHPSWIWLIGNEPELAVQDALVTGTVSVMLNNNILTTYELKGPEKYAIFFKDIYDTIQEGFEENLLTSQPKLVFCQSAYAGYLPTNNYAGLGYCSKAFLHLACLTSSGMTCRQIAPNETSKTQARAMIYALSTHQYMHGPEVIGNSIYDNGKLLTRDTIVGTQTILQHAIALWSSYLQEFEEWAAEEGMGDKPLWLTEYGSLSAWCYETHDASPPEGGVRCQGVNGNNVFYGRASNEGLWGLQQGQMAYMWQSGRWKAAWWFVSGMEKSSGGQCYQTAWLWGADFDCRPPSNYPHPDEYDRSRVGITHYQVINCLANHTDCQGQPATSPDLPPLDPITHPWGHYCKITAEQPCRPSTPTPTPTATPTTTSTPSPTPTPTPTPTVTPLPTFTATPYFNPAPTVPPSCGCGTVPVGEECPQVHEC